MKSRLATPRRSACPGQPLLTLLLTLSLTSPGDNLIVTILTVIPMVQCQAGTWCPPSRTLETSWVRLSRMRWVAACHDTALPGREETHIMVITQCHIVTFTASSNMTTPDTGDRAETLTLPEMSIDKVEKYQSINILSVCYLPIIWKFYINSYDQYRQLYNSPHQIPHP